MLQRAKWRTLIPAILRLWPRTMAPHGPFVDIRCSRQWPCTLLRILHPLQQPLWLSTPHCSSSCLFRTPSPVVEYTVSLNSQWSSPLLQLPKYLQLSHERCSGSELNSGAWTRSRFHVKLARCGDSFMITRPQMQTNLDTTRKTFDAKHECPQSMVKDARDQRMTYHIMLITSVLTSMTWWAKSVACTIRSLGACAAARARIVFTMRWNSSTPLRKNWTLGQNTLSRWMPGEVH